MIRPKIKMPRNRDHQRGWRFSCANDFPLFPVGCRRLQAASVCRTEARNATVGSDDRAASSTPVEANRPPGTDLNCADRSNQGRGGEYPGGASRYSAILRGPQRTDPGRRLTSALPASKGAPGPKGEGGAAAIGCATGTGRAGG